MDNLLITVTIKRRSDSGRELTTIVESKPRSLSHADMKRLWEAEQALNEMVHGVRFHIDVKEV